MAARGHTIPGFVRDVLRAETATYAGPRVTINDRLEDRTWAQVKRVLELLGAIYVPRASAWVFEPDQNAEQIVHDALAQGRILRPANADGFVATGHTLAAELVSEYANVPLISGRPLRILEPSGGTGSIVDVVCELYGMARTQVLAIEPNARRAANIQARGDVSVIVDTFEAFCARAKDERFDLIVMNPPFAQPGRPYMWADHLLAAWDLLAPGGRLMAITRDTVLDAKPRGAQVRRACALVRRHGSGKLLAPDAFAPAQIGVRTALVRLDRPLSEVPILWPEERHPALFRVYGDEVPVPVTRLFLTRGAADTTPVQIWADPVQNRLLRTLRYCADCVICTMPLWLFDDGDNTPLGALRSSSGCWSLKGDHLGWSEDAVGLCVACFDDGDKRAEAQRLAENLRRRVAYA